MVRCTLRRYPRMQFRRQGAFVSHNEAKLLLAQAETYGDRRNAVASALTSGMPLHEIEEFLDWVDAVRAKQQVATVPGSESLIGAVLRHLSQKPEVQ
jgi:hypothetical protein